MLYDHNAPTTHHNKPTKVGTGSPASQRLHVELNGLTDVGQGLVAGVTLTVAAGKGGHANGIATVSLVLQNNGA
jgi:hypothetical protein